MEKLALMMVVALVAMQAPIVASAQSYSFANALERMDEIIAEMEALRAEFATLRATVQSSNVNTGQSAVLGVQTSGQSSIGFTEPLEYGETNEDIRYIQSLLATDPEIYPYGVASGFFGPKTQEAIRNLQERFGLNPVGVIGPATRTILEAFLAAYPTGNFPDDVLTQVPQVSGSSAPTTSNTATTPVTTTPVTTGTNPIFSVEGEYDRGEVELEIEYRSGRSVDLIVSADTLPEIARAVARRTGDDAANILAVLDVDGLDDDEDGNRYDEDDAEDAIDDADDAIDDADDEIDEARDDGEDTDLAEDILDDAEDLLEEAEKALEDEEYDEAVDLAEEAEELAGDAEDAIGEDENDKGDNDDIDEITADVRDEDETDVTVEYDDGSEYEFELEEDKRDEIIEEIADELDMDEDDVEDVIDIEWLD